MAHLTALLDRAALSSIFVDLSLVAASATECAAGARRGRGTEGGHGIDRAAMDVLERGGEPVDLVQVRLGGLLDVRGTGQVALDAVLAIAVARGAHRRGPAANELPIAT
ncbi:MAG: hypothetical protein M3422_25440 [Actinomycetota bacterium]|nr:hypothetical protein [Actinomycetota bacterium]